MSDGREIVGMINMKLDYEMFKSLCGHHDEAVVLEKWNEFIRCWPTVRYILADAIDTLTGEEI